MSLHHSLVVALLGVGVGVGVLNKRAVEALVVTCRMQSGRGSEPRGLGWRAAEMAFLSFRCGV
jgi:hypothetical protein